MAFSQSGTLRRRPREEVDGHRVHADLGEAVREILVVLVETTHPPGFCDFYVYFTKTLRICERCQMFAT